MAPVISERLLPVLQVRRWASRGRLFAVIDACDAPEVPKTLLPLGQARAVSLYRGDAEKDLWGIAPYLARIDEELFDWLTRTLWSTPWGIFAVSDESLAQLRTHFRRFLMVETPAGESWYFRFYDPRVLARFLPTLGTKELAEFLGPVRALGVTDPESYGVHVLTPAASQPITVPLRSS